MESTLPPFLLLGIFFWCLHTLSPSLPTTDGQDKFEELLASLAEPAVEEDVYAQLGRTMLHPSLPKELVLTDQNFEDRIMAADKTAVLFYLSCEMI